jgi:hypothetical protein
MFDRDMRENRRQEPDRRWGRSRRLETRRQMLLDTAEELRTGMDRRLAERRIRMRRLCMERRDPNRDLFLSAEPGKDFYNC